MSFYKLVEIAYNLPSISESEWVSKMLTRETQKSLGLRSPKLSKFLLSRGVPEKVFQHLMVNKKCESYFSPCWEEQGNSIHYSSCQARDPRAKWFQRHEEGYSLWQEGDATASEKGWVHLWVVGRPMSENGEGFLARAKVRMVYSGADIIGAFVDRMYGQKELLDIEGDLKVLLKEKYGKEIPVLRLGGNLKGEVPSSKLGYQDTFKVKEQEEYNFFCIKGPFLDALQKRLATPLWLRQEYREILEGKPPKRKEFRGKAEMEFPKKVKALLGLPKPFRISKVEEKRDVYWDISGYTLNGSEKAWIFSHYMGGLIHKKPNGIFVEEDLPELGFYKPRRIKRKQ